MNFRDKVSSYIVDYKKELSLVVLMGLNIFLFLSLYSFNPLDQSLFYCSSDPQVTNFCGIMGAKIAAWLHFLLGSTSILLVYFLGFLTSLIWRNVSLHEEWERIVALSFGIVGASTVNSAHKVFSGGYIGHQCYQFLSQCLYPLGALLLSYTLVAISIILFTRLGFMPVVQYIIYLFERFYYFLMQYQVAQHVFRKAHGLVWYSIQPCVFVKNFLLSVLDGSALEGTGLIVPTHEWMHEDSCLHEVSNDDFFPNQTMPEPVQQVYQEEAPVVQTPPKVPMVEKTKQSLFSRFSPKKSAVSRSTRFKLPNLSLFLRKKNVEDDQDVKKALDARARILEEKLQRFGVSGSVVSIKQGPVVTLFEYAPDIDTKLSKILSLEDDLALALQAMSIRILAPIPGRPVVGFEVANKKRKPVLLADIIQSNEFVKFKGDLPLVLGVDTIGNNVVVDLGKMPHLLIAGSTGSGKSVALNTMLLSLLCKCTPAELKLILIDPKRLEFATFADIPHLLFPIVVDPKKTPPVLRWVVHQMEYRYEQMAKVGVRSISDYNEHAKHDQTLQELPFIVVVIDELADLMMTVGRDIEDLIARITQMARAAGIHLIVATQRPSVDVITGLIKVNFPSRISFRVTSKIDSRTIIDGPGAEKLLGKGDMLFLDSSSAILKRVHGAYTLDKEINDVVRHIKAEREVDYLDLDEMLNQEESDIPQADLELFNKIKEYLEEVDHISISLLQRKFRIGYNRSARIMEMLESQGLILPADGSKMRRVIRK